MGDIENLAFLPFPVRTLVALSDINAFDDKFQFARKSSDNLAGLAFVFSRYYHHRVIFLDLHMIILNDFRRKRDDALKTFLSELARNRSEDAAADRRVFLLGLGDNDNSVLVKANIRAILATERLALADNHRFQNILLLDRLSGFGALNGQDDDIADLGVAFLGSAEHFENSADLGAGVVSYFND